MDVLIVTVFVSLVLVVGGLLFFVSRLRDGDFEHGDRLSLLPLQDDDKPGMGSPSRDPENLDIESVE
jgi:hypothetical protein